MSSFDKQGVNTSPVFAGESELLANQQMYAAGIDLFAKVLRQRLQPHHPYQVVDIGSYKGEFVQSVLDKLPEFDLRVTAIDVNYLALEDNHTASSHIVSNVLDIDAADSQFDIGVCRFVINWNPLELQLVIIKEIVRIVRDFVLVQHSGTDSDQPEHRKRLNTLLSGVIPKIHREDFCHTTSAELEMMLRSAGIRYTKISEQRIDYVSDIFYERYDLSDAERVLAQNIMGEYDYILQSTWIFEHSPV